MGSVLKEPISDQNLGALVSAAKDFTFSHGVIIRSQLDLGCPDVAIHAPFTLFPSPLPRRCFREAIDLQPHFNTLMHRIAHDRDFLADCLKSVIKIDDFTKRIFNIYEAVRDEGVQQPISLAMNRSDYMVDYRLDDPSILNPDGILLKVEPRLLAPDAAFTLRQVEFNTMAAGMAGLSQRLYPYHRFILEERGLRDKVENVPVNRASDGMAEAMVTTWNLYGNINAVVLFLVYAADFNTYDQRRLEYSMYKRDRRVKVIRRTLEDIRTRGQLTIDRRLIVDGLEVAIVYQRSCYTPLDFPTEEDWQCRLMLERSRAVVCPSAGYHLAGTKKVQQTLAKPGVVERFVVDPEVAERIRATFAGQYTLDMNEEGDRNVAMAIRDPYKFVLKPQREGGGNNLYDTELRTLLERIGTSDERSVYILMERIQPMTVLNYPVISGQDVQLTKMSSELGIFGALVGTNDEIFLNQSTGYLLRTKRTDMNEGGVARGNSVLDSPYLID